MSEPGDHAPKPAPISKARAAEPSAAPLISGRDETPDSRRSVTFVDRTQDVSKDKVLDAQEQVRTRQRELADRALWKKLINPKHWYQAAKYKYGEDYLTHRGALAMQQAAIDNDNANVTMD